MRVISQNGTMDFPYDNSLVFLHESCIKGNTCVEIQLCGDTEIDIVAEYSTEEKAVKAMEMLREQYSRIEIIKALASGTCKHMEESLKPEEFKHILEKYINMEVFQFPQDDEIEV